MGAASCVPRTLASTVASIFGVAGAAGFGMAVCIAAAMVASMLGMAGSGSVAFGVTGAAEFGMAVCMAAATVASMLGATESGAVAFGVQAMTKTAINTVMNRNTFIVQMEDR